MNRNRILQQVWSRRSIYILSALLATGVIHSACDENTSLNLNASESYEARSEPSDHSASMLFEESFEGKTPFSTAYKIENCGTDWTLSFPQAPSQEGKAARFE